MGRERGKKQRRISTKMMKYWWKRAASSWCAAYVHKSINFKLPCPIGFCFAPLCAIVLIENTVVHICTSCISMTAQIDHNFFFFSALILKHIIFSCIAWKVCLCVRLCVDFACALVISYINMDVMRWLRHGPTTWYVILMCALKRSWKAIRLTEILIRK